MAYKNGEHVYLAAPFFNDNQRELCSFIEGLESIDLPAFQGYFQPIYSPRKDGIVLTPNSTIEECNEAFQANTNAINASSFVLGVIDDFDPGVLWEMGYAYAQDKEIVAYSDVPGRTINVMLVGSATAGFINGREDLASFFLDCSMQDWSNNALHVDPSIFPNNTWGGQIQ